MAAAWSREGEVAERIDPPNPETLRRRAGVDSMWLIVDRIPGNSPNASGT